VDFDGVDGNIYAGDPASGVLDFNAGEPFTIAAWIKRDTSSSLDEIVGKKYSSNPSEPGYIYEINLTDPPSVRISDGTNDCTIGALTQVPLNEWHHVAMSRDGDGSVTFYYDGEEDGGGACNAGDLRNDKNFMIGDDEFGFSIGTGQFDGSIDGVRVYNRFLSADEVTALYELRIGGSDAGLLSHFSFNGPDIRGTTAIDRGQGGNHGTIVGAVPAIGKLGQGLRFDGVDDRVTVGDVGSPISTIALWFKNETSITSGSSGSFLMKLSAGSSGDTGSICLGSCTGFVDGETLTFKGEDGSSGSAYTGTIPAGWHHALFVFTGGAYQIYLDGEHVGATTYGTPAIESGDEVAIGHSSLTPILGSLDDVRIYDRALSAAEVLALYKESGATLTANASQNTKETNGLVGLWSFDGPDMDWRNGLALDRSGNGNNGTLGTAIATIGKVGQGIHLQGNPWDFIVLSDVNMLNLGTGDQTITGWMKIPPGQAFWKKFFSKADPGGEGHMAYYDHDSDEVVVFVDTGAAHTYYRAPVPYNVEDNKWHHYGWVIDRDAGVSFYLDGAFLEKDGTSVYNGTDISNVNVGSIGGNDGNTEAGSFDEVRIYNRVLSATEIRALYQQGGG
jgi:hypothetical protein